MAGLTEVPVVVLDVSDQQVEVLRIEENLRRRGLKPSETARAIRRLYELHGIGENKGGRPSKGSSSIKFPVSTAPCKQRSLSKTGSYLFTAPKETTTATVEVKTAPKKTVAEVARDAGVSPTQASVYNRLADLIGPLMQLLDARTITQEMAYGFAQLPATSRPLGR